MKKKVFPALLFVLLPAASPPIDVAEQLAAVDHYWQGSDLVVQYNVVDGTNQE